MTQPWLELADVIRLHGTEFLKASGSRLAAEQRRALSDIAACRTAALGGHVEACDRCGHQRIAYNSCRNRHCPKCQAMAGADWVAARVAELLPVPYFHVVFTLPDVLGPLALQNPRVVYDLLFRAASETLLQVAADPKHLGAQVGFVAVLHTWGQALQHHPHLHCVVPGGGLSSDGSRWVQCPPRFFLPVRILGAVFRGKFLELLRAAFDQGRLFFAGRLIGLSEPTKFRQRLAASARTDWVVYAKPPFGGTAAALKYLARYTHRVAISNRRLLGLNDGRVQFRYKEYARGGKRRGMELAASEFLRRFLQHVLPSGFVRIRYYGLLAHCCRRACLERCRALLGTATVSGVTADGPPVVPVVGAATVAKETRLRHCPMCTLGRMIVVAELRPCRRERVVAVRIWPYLVFDTS